MEMEKKSEKKAAAFLYLSRSEMNRAFLFPGQGSQSVGMGKELYNEIPEAKEILNQACEFLSYDLKRLMFEGSVDILTDTKYAQPAIYTCSAMYLEKAKRQELDYNFVAGHSLGEYSALYAAGVFSFVEGLSLIDKRSKAMALENGKGTMAAVMGLTEDELSPYIASQNNVVMANLNTKNQIVISGMESNVDAVANQLGKNKSVAIKKLAVSAAFHSPQMIYASHTMEKELKKIELKEPSAFVVSNVTGNIAKNTDEIRQNLIAQMTGQVRWYDSIMTMKTAGVEQFYEVGNGNVLRKLNRAITLTPKCYSV